MTELKALGLVDMDGDRGEADNSEKDIRLKPEFSWFLSDEFLQLRHTPHDGRQQSQLKENLPLSNQNSGVSESSVDTQMLKEKYPIRHVNNNNIINDPVKETLPCSDQTSENMRGRGEFSFSYIGKEPILWRIYGELEAKSQDNTVK